MRQGTSCITLQNQLVYSAGGRYDSIAPGWVDVENVSHADELGWVGEGEGVHDVLASFFKSRIDGLTAERMPGELIAALRDFVLLGGKRLRPTLCVMGWLAAGGRDNTQPVPRVAASLEMFHAFALIHDDIVDDSATRRGRPAVHRAFTEHYSLEGRSTADRLGVSARFLLAI